MGLINAVVPHEELMPAARAMAQRIMRHSRLAAASIIAAVTRGINVSIGEGLRMEGEQFARMVPTYHFSEGLNAWKDRWPPVYAGR